MNPLAGLPLFDTDLHRKRVTVCAWHLRKLARRRKDYGVTAFDTRQIALRHGYATGMERDQRALSWMAAVPKVARLRKTNDRRTGTNRNQHVVWVLS